MHTADSVLAGAFNSNVDHSLGINKGGVLYGGTSFSLLSTLKTNDKTELIVINDYKA